MTQMTTLLLTLLPLVKNLVIILSVWAVKEAVTRLAFECYCLDDDDDNDWWTSNDARELYSFLFLVVPAVFFWIAGTCSWSYQQSSSG